MDRSSRRRAAGAIAAAVFIGIAGRASAELVVTANDNHSVTVNGVLSAAKTAAAHSIAARTAGNGSW